MQIKWLNKSNNKKLIVFFNGWGMDEKIVSHLNTSDYDVLTIFNYTSFELDMPDFSKYDNKILIAWSMGVYACNYFYELFKDFNKIIAINGTLNPIDDIYGIPKLIYNLTIENFNDLSCSKFMKKISTETDLKNYCTRNLEELKNELIQIRDLKVNEFLNFNKAVISTKDRIFPYKNLLRYWSEQSVEIKEIEAPHYIFDLYKSWNELV